MARILYVKDNDDNVYMLKNRLERRGLAGLVARDGRAGGGGGRAEPPDLILLDLGLPVIDGWEAARLLKADERTRAIPVIALSAHAMAGDRAPAPQARRGAHDTQPGDFA